MRKTIILLLISLFSAITLWGQGGTPSGFFPEVEGDSVVRDTLFFSSDIDLSLQLLPLDSILKIAFENSPAIKYEDAMIETKVQNLRYTRILMFQGISGFYNYTLGDQFTVVQGTNALNNAQFSNGQRYGVSIQIPLSTILGQGRKNKQMKAELLAAKYRKDQVIRDVNREVRRIYVNMIEAQRKMNVRVADAQAALEAVDVAEEELREGKLPPIEFARIKNIHAIALSNLENERANFMRAFLDFEVLVGVDMAQLKKPTNNTPKPTAPKK